jgi:hypothetical protein
MVTLLERHVASIDRRLLLLSPTALGLPGHFKDVTTDSDQHRGLLHELQRLRGAIYLKDGAVRRQELSVDGRHQTPEDERSWHLLIRNDDGSLNACIWYLEHPNHLSFHQLRARSCPLTAQPEWRERIQSAVEVELEQARRDRVAYSEVGGWAVSESGRCTPEGLLLILATFGLSRALGGALGLATATVRHSSAAILRRLGLSRLAGLPAYFDPHYGCEMELLRFDTRRSSARYEGLIALMKDRLSCVPVVARHDVVALPMTGTAAA